MASVGKCGDADFSLLEGPQQPPPTAVALAAAAPATEAMTGTRVFPDVSSKGVAEAPTLSAGAASAAIPAAALATGGTVFPTASVGGAARAPASADETAESKAAPATSGTVPSATPLRGAVGARESSAGAASSDAVAEAAPSTGDTTAPDASGVKAAMKLTSAAGSSSKICGERRASTHPFDPGTVFPLKIRYYNSSWPKHGSNSNSSSSSNSSGNGSSSSSNDTTSNHDSWWEATCVGALLRPFDPGKGCWLSARRGKTVRGLDLPFDRGKHGANAAWRVTGFVLRVSSWLLFGLFRGRLENRVLGRILVVSGCWTSLLMGIFAFKPAKVEVWFQLECAPEQLVSVVTANRHFYVATFFLWYPDLII